MLTLITMLLITTFLGYLLLIRDTTGIKNRFFDVNTTTTMRGFWCLVVMLVHVPKLHQNLIQDLLGSFAYIGVTFFFMTSSYGLMLSIRKRNDAALKEFWKRRLPKLLFPMILVNILAFASDAVIGTASFRTLLDFSDFVSQIIMFYLIFWLVFRIPAQRIAQTGRTYILCVCVVIISLVIYATEDFCSLKWPTESMGFLYGILLAEYADIFIEKISKRWILSCVLSCVLALILGVFYLQVKYETFWGDYVVKILLGCSILVFVLSINTKYAIGNAAGRFLGKISYEVFLLHGLVFRWVDYVLGPIDSGLYILVSMIVTVC